MSFNYAAVQQKSLLFGQSIAVDHTKPVADILLFSLIVC